MSENQIVQNKGGISFLGLLGIVFITLKLTGYITWSWWWVLLPLYAPLAIALVLMGIILLLAFMGVALGITNK